MVTGKALHGAAPKRETGAVARAHPYGRGHRVVSKRSTRHLLIAGGGPWALGTIRTRQPRSRRPIEHAVNGNPCRAIPTTDPVAL